MAVRKVEDREGNAGSQEEHDDENGDENVATVSSFVFGLFADVATQDLFGGPEDFRF